MENPIQLGQTLKTIEQNIKAEIAKYEFWGDLELSFDETDILKERINAVLGNSGVDVGYMCKTYPYAMTTYMVFFVRYKYDVNFWGALAEELGVEISQYLHEELGSCARRMFTKYKMDFSDTKDEARINIAPIIFEACLPPESSLDDLFYVMSYDSFGVFDPQLIIDELIEMRSYTIRKPMLRFLSRFKDDRAVDFVLEVRDAMIAAEQRSARPSRYIGHYTEWKEQEKSKAAVNNRKNQEFQTRPYLFFDNGKKGLCVILPRTIMNSEWVVEATWNIKTRDGFEKTVYCNFMGDGGRRYTDTLAITVPPAEKYIISLSDSEGLDEKAGKEWEIEGIKNDKIVFFNANGRQINANYLLSPYGIMIIPDTIAIEKTSNIEVIDQFYPTNSEKYRITSVTPIGNDASFTYKTASASNTITARPQINMVLSGKTLFSLDEVNPNANIFTEIPSLNITVDGVMGTNGLEIRVGGVSHQIDIDISTDNIFEIKKLAKKEIDGYGTYSIRLYQFGRFLKQVEFSYVPKIKTNYSPIISWTSDNDRRLKKTYKFQRLEDWEMEFGGCIVGGDDANYSVEVPSNVGEIPVVLKSMSDDFIFSCEFTLPVRPCDFEIVDRDGNVIENVTDRVYKVGLDEILETESWLTIRTFGGFKTLSYKVLLKTANGVEQEKYIWLTQNGAGNLNLSMFYDTLRNCPLPAEVVIMCDDDEEKTIVIARISEKTSMEVRPKYQQGEKKSFVILDMADDRKDIDLSRFGFNYSEVHIPYSESLLGKSGKTRGYVYPGRIGEGIYIVSGSKEQSIFDFEDDDIVDLALGKNIFLVSSRDKETVIENSKHLINLLVGEAIYSDTNKDLSMGRAYVFFNNEQMLDKITDQVLDDADIEKLVALGYFVNSKIVNSKKEQLRECMRKISVHFMHRGDRYRIIELLTELNAPQEVFDICMKEYSLLLCHVDESNAKQLAEKVESYSTELAMVIMMGTDGSIRDCMWREKFRDLIGRDSVKQLLDVPKEEDPEIIAEEQKKFIRGIAGSKVRINLTNEISGNEEAIQGMIGYDKKYNPIFDLSKKPDYGIYFAKIKYVDQYVNWYKNTHNRNMEMDPVKRQMMIDIVKENIKDIEKSIAVLKSDKELKKMTEQYVKTLEERFRPNSSIISLTTACYPRFFYLEGLAAFFAKLPVDRADLDGIRNVGIKFMSVASVIAPRLSQRDILMATTYIFLKRKEEKLCR